MPRGPLTFTRPIARQPAVISLRRLACPPIWRFVIRWFAISAISLTLLVITVLPARAAMRYGPMPKHWHAPPWWLSQAVCIHDHEGAWPDATGNGYEGGLQFLLSTWESVGGPVVRDRRGYVHWASVAPIREQLYRAWLVWRRDGGSWREWGTARACGLR